MKKKG
jgi:hypothetical protein